VCCVLFGHGGVGKTTLACTAQDSPFGQDVLLIDVDLGVESVTDRDDIMVEQPDQWKTNRPASGATIYTGAGPIGSAYSPTRLTVQLIGC